ncbi:hypothetical protein EB796_018017 [Bugula neritina]|uniref:GST C-terminal domain-containing protein n=1 Tax=Bugula neritina TaxID=10212 RepID=A0A7J7JBP5_BUGNE|nr:hypothetical protein EB796_018017 [Bugula neritina]
MQYFTLMTSMARPGCRFLFGEKITVADIVLYCTVEYCCVRYPETRAFNTWLVDWLKHMEQDALFCKYLKSRSGTCNGT